MKTIKVTSALMAECGPVAAFFEAILVPCLPGCQAFNGGRYVSIHHDPRMDAPQVAYVTIPHAASDWLMQAMDSPTTVYPLEFELEIPAAFLTGKGGTA